MDLVHRRALEPHRGPVLTSATLTPETTEFLADLTGAAPADPALWCEALTHGSMGTPRDYQRLEFLGDAVLGLVVNEDLFQRYPDRSEGDLTKMKSLLVCGARPVRLA